MTTDLYAQARDAADRGEAATALDLIGRAYDTEPSDPAVRELYAALHVAKGIRLGASAREARRRDIVRRRLAVGEEFQDPVDVAGAFDEALGMIDRALSADPKNEKALIMKAAVLFRKDREHLRPQALEILRAIEVAHPENRQIVHAIRKIERPCEACSDTGFCAACGARGTRRRLRIESKCETCHGQGICLRCGIV